MEEQWEISISGSKNSNKYHTEAKNVGEFELRLAIYKLVCLIEEKFGTDLQITFDVIAKAYFSDKAEKKQGEIKCKIKENGPLR